MGKIVFVVGGAKSGKSKFAMELAKKGAKEVVYIATARAQDEEMELKIKKHIKSRPKDWRTIEEPLDLPRAIRNIKGKDKVVLIDCITLYISNILLKGYSEKKNPREINRLNVWILNEVRKMVSAINASPHTFIIVSNEVGMGIVPENKVARLFRDIHGESNQIIAKVAESVYIVMAGIATKIK